MGESVLDQRRVRLDAAEKRADLFAARVDGWSPWRVIRHYVQRSVAPSDLLKPRRNQGPRIASAIAATFRLVALLAWPPKVGLMVKTQRSGLRVAAGDRCRDVYFDGLLTDGDHHFKLEAVDSLDFNRQARVALFPRHLDPIVFTFWGRVLGMLFPAPSGDFAERVSNLVSSEVGAEIPAAPLRLMISSVYWQKRLYGLLLRRLRPTVALVCNTGEYGLVLACRKAGIPVVELQHGVFDASHPDAVPNWAAGTPFELVMPNVLATKSRHWIRLLAGTHQAAVAVAVGNESIDEARERRAARQIDLAKQAPVWRMVLTSQGLQTEQLADWVEAAVAAAPPDQEWRMTIKLHPVYDAETTAFDRLASHPRVTVVPGDGRPNVFELLAEADLHMSIASACLFEAAALDVPSLIIPIPGHEEVLSGVDGGLLRLAGSPAEVWTTIDDAPFADPAAYAEPGFVSNMRRMLSDLNPGH